MVLVVGFLVVFFSFFFPLHISTKKLEKFHVTCISNYNYSAQLEFTILISCSNLLVNNLEARSYS